MQTKKRAAGESRIEIIRKIVERHQARTIDGRLIDVFTANMLKQVYDLLVSEESKAKFERMPLMTLVNFGWSKVSGCKND